MNTSLILCVIFLPVWVLVVRGGGGLVQLSTPLSLVQVLLIHPVIITRVTEVIGDANLSLCGGGGGKIPTSTVSKLVDKHYQL